VNYIHDKNGDIIQRSHNLAGIRRYAKHGVDEVHLLGFEDGTGLLQVDFVDGASSTIGFASFELLQKFVRNWRNARGAGLVVNGFHRGRVTSKEPCDYPACTKV
jgi:hypothetical protein